MADTPHLFQPGHIVSTRGALRALIEARVEGLALVERHLQGDFGDLCTHDRELNSLAIQLGDRVLSSYLLPTPQKVWVITEADRSVTTLLLPEEY